MRHEQNWFSHPLEVHHGSGQPGQDVVIRLATGVAEAQFVGRPGGYDLWCDLLDVLLCKTVKLASVHLVYTPQRLSDHLSPWLAIFACHDIALYKSGGLDGTLEGRRPQAPWHHPRLRRIALHEDQGRVQGAGDPRDLLDGVGGILEVRPITGLHSQQPHAGLHYGTARVAEAVPAARCDEALWCLGDALIQPAQLLLRQGYADD
mmetsp:Transcript_22926/g.60572  ORF Transcript_22926/g.60572 Transcript_22926/m.60572 type:complete len:205 (-) Transcript_22926:515-1129(-)